MERFPKLLETGMAWKADGYLAARGPVLNFIYLPCTYSTTGFSR